MRDTTGKGNVSLMKIASKFAEKGYSVLFPFLEGGRYDLVVEKEGKFKRIQCKTGKLKKDSIVVKLHSCTQLGVRYYTKKEIDSFGVFCPQNDKVYLLNIEEISRTSMVLRLQKTKNNSKVTNWAKDYEL